ncbi:MAG: hypothetical protein ETSY1_30895 [Candidatus Entotheonella factor]|uniref:Uncharacterized protein n=1 Tax=Entotheonella factor TaxID=1429438 RepID=W4LBU9_ENTF1|nr:MAG: hypothetical protein ETSY1_30895 [Candidatus Entotheonella factor]
MVAAKKGLGLETNAAGTTEMACLCVAGVTRRTDQAELPGIPNNHRLAVVTLLGALGNGCPAGTATQDFGVDGIVRRGGEFFATNTENKRIIRVGDVVLQVAGSAGDELHKNPPKMGFVLLSARPGRTDKDF